MCCGVVVLTEQCSHPNVAVWWVSDAIRTSKAWHTYSDFQSKLLVTVLSGQGIENRWELLGIELDVCIAASAAG